MPAMYLAFVGLSCLAFACAAFRNTSRPRVEMWNTSPGDSHRHHFEKQRSLKLQPKKVLESHKQCTPTVQWALIMKRMHKP